MIGSLAESVVVGIFEAFLNSMGKKADREKKKYKTELKLDLDYDTDTVQRILEKVDRSLTKTGWKLDILDNVSIDGTVYIHLRVGRDGL